MLIQLCHYDKQTERLFLFTTFEIISNLIDFDLSPQTSRITSRLKTEKKNADTGTLQILQVKQANKKLRKMILAKQ